MAHKSVRQLLVMLSKCCVALAPEHAGGAVEWVDLATARARMQAMFREEVADFDRFFALADVLECLQATTSGTKRGAHAGTTADSESAKVAENGAKAPARDSIVSVDTARFPQYLRAGYRPMMYAHEDFWAAVLAEQPPHEFAMIDDKSLGAFAFRRNTGGQLNLS